MTRRFFVISTFCCATQHHKHTHKNVDNISTAIHLLCWEGVVFFLLLWSRSCGSFSCNRTVAALSFFFKRDGWMDAEEDVKTKKLFRFLVFFFLPPRLCQTAPSLPWGFIFFFPFKKQNKKPVAPTTTGLNQATSVLRKKTPVREKKKNCTRFIFHPSSRKRKFFFQEKWKEREAIRIWKPLLY